jgi:hypothetical protein
VVQDDVTISKESEHQVLFLWLGKSSPQMYHKPLDPPASEKSLLPPLPSSHCTKRNKHQQYQWIQQSPLGQITCLPTSQAGWGFTSQLSSFQNSPSAQQLGYHTYIMYSLIE